MSTLIKDFWDEDWVKVVFNHPTRRNDYFISNYGRIKSSDKVTKDEKLMKGSTLKRGYKAVNVRLKDEKYGHVFVHKFVAENFLNQESEIHSNVIHLDFDRSNNHFNNLKWVTDEYWHEYVKNTPRVKAYRSKPVRNNSKLTETKVKLLKQRLKKGKTKHKILARQFGITVTQLKRIESGENWGDVKI